MVVQEFKEFKSSRVELLELLEPTRVSQDDTSITEGPSRVLILSRAS
jgi:hypothetical protein